MTENKSGARMLLWSIIISAPGPLAVGLSLIAGRSSTQIANFVRRSAELLAIIMAFVVYKAVEKEGVCDERKKTLERRSNTFVGSTMCLAGAVMALLWLTSENTDHGNVVPGLVVAILGAVSNLLLWIKYVHLAVAEGNAILTVQARLYRAKTFVDTSVTVALLAVLIAPQSAIAYWLDFVGTMVVAVYLLWCGVKTVYEERKHS